jgi:hypothetical protein
MQQLHVQIDHADLLAQSASQVLAGDGGYRREPVAFPADGLFMGVAERYEVREA